MLGRLRIPFRPMIPWFGYRTLLFLMLVVTSPLRSQLLGMQGNSLVGTNFITEQGRIEGVGSVFSKSLDSSYATRQQMNEMRTSLVWKQKLKFAGFSWRDGAPVL